MENVWSEKKVEDGTWENNISGTVIRYKRGKSDHFVMKEKSLMKERTIRQGAQQCL